MKSSITVMAVGDLVLQKENHSFYFEPSAPVLQSADVAIGQIEVPHTTSTEVTGIVVPAPPALPEDLKVIADAGFTIGTVAGNHCFDCGTQGVLDTIRYSNEYGIKTTGTGASLAEARTPAVQEVKGQRVGVLSYNLVGPRETLATSKKAGNAYVKVMTHYELDDANPGNAATVYTFCEPASLEAMRADIRALAADVDLVVVALHMGIGHTPATIADYERQASMAAIDAGADAVVGCHAHIMRGIQMYQGRPIYYGMGNFVTVTDALTPGAGNSVEQEAWARRRRELYGFSPDPAMPAYPFHPESRNAAIAVIGLSESGEVTAGLIPCWIDDDARPVPLDEGDKGREVLDYITNISRISGFDTNFTWEGGRVRLSSIAKEATR